MNSAGWHIQRTPEQVILSRQLPARFDVLAATTLRLQAGQGISLSRVAHQVRQDLWRELQNLRGFSPVVEVSQTGASIRIRAGGRAPAPIAPNLPDRIRAVLENPQKQMRWMRHATRKQAAKAAPLEGAA